MDYTPDRIVYDVNSRVFRDNEGNEVVNTSLLPTVTIGERKWINLLLVTDSSLAPYSIPVGSSANIIVDNDFLNDNPILPLLSGNDNWELTTNNEYAYFRSIPEPDYVLFNDDKKPRGTKGSLSAGEWDWEDNILYVRLDDSTDPDTKDNGFVSFNVSNPNATNPFILVDSGTFNENDTWYDIDNELYRNPSLLNGEITFEVNANTVDFWERLGANPKITSTSLQLQIIAPATTTISEVIEFAYICKNRFIANGVALELSGINFFTKAEINANFYNKSEINAFNFATNGIQQSITIDDNADISTTHFNIGKVRTNKGTDLTLTIQTQANGNYVDDCILDIVNIGDGNATIQASNGVNLNFTNQGAITIEKGKSCKLDRISADNWLIANYELDI